MDIEKRKLFAEIFGGIAFFALFCIVGYFMVKHYHRLNSMILFSVIGAFWILAGMLAMMINRNSYLPAGLMLIGLAEQGMMLFIYLKASIIFGAATVGGLAFVMLLIYILDPLDIRKRKPEEKFEPIIEQPFANWPDPVGQEYLKKLQEERQKEAKIISFAEKAEEIRKERKREPACKSKDEQAS